MSDEKRSAKRCFVTVGATASFTKLIKAVLSESFLRALQQNGYTELRVQYGKDGQKTFEDAARLLLGDFRKDCNMEITGFDFDTTGLRGEMVLAKQGGRHDGKEGCIISHAGSGSILDALRISCPIVVVPNTDLLDNHQVELAEILAEQHYVVYGDLENLESSLSGIETLRQDMQIWPPITSKGKRAPRQALASVIDNELGWFD